MHNLGKCNIIINLSRNITFFIEMKKRQDNSILNYIYSKRYRYRFSINRKRGQFLNGFYSNCRKMNSL